MSTTTPAAPAERTNAAGTDGPTAPRAATALRPLRIDAVALGDGLLGDLQRRNAERAVRLGATHLREEGAFENFARAGRGERAVEYHGPVFEDGEVYKWLEAVAWTLATTDGHADRDLVDLLDEVAALIVAAQADDGYLNTFTTTSGKRAERYEDLSLDHEIFNNGAFVQAAVAAHRSTGREDLLEVAVRVADHLDATFGEGPGKRQGACGHPVAEMALVELYRETGERRYLDLARFFVDFRGHGALALPWGPFGAPYFSDRVPVRQQASPEGHAVRAVYLAAGATDVAIETEDADLFAALVTQWEHMVGSKMYVTGGLGARWEGEAFGDPFELPSDRAYAETCAAIASVQWSWRLLLATGDPRYADLIERQLHNAVLPALGLDGETYFYVNALRVREGAVVDDPGERTPAHGRQHWFGCSCCPTNLMRTLASVQHYLASGDERSLQVHQYTSSTIRHTLADGEVAVRVDTAYPWDGTIRLTVVETPASDWRLDLRVPGWVASGARLRTGDGTRDVAPGVVSVDRAWRVGDEVTLELPMAPRLVRADDRVDDARGQVAMERGPLVFAVEQVDMTPDVQVDDVVVLDGPLLDAGPVPELGDVPAVTFEAGVTEPLVRGYHPAHAGTSAIRPVGRLRAVPYFRWANRGAGAMRVWLTDGR